MAASGNNQTLNITVGANMDVSGVLNGVKQMQGAFNGLKIPPNLANDMIKDFNKLKESLVNFERLAKQEHFSKADLKLLDKLQKEIDATFGHLTNSFNDLTNHKFYLEADYSKIQEAREVVNQLKTDLENKLSNIKIDFTTTSGKSSTLGLNDMLDSMERGVKSSKVLSAAMAQVRQSVQAGDFGQAKTQLDAIVTKASELKGAGTGLFNLFSRLGVIKLDKPAADLVKTTEGTNILKAGLAALLPMFDQNSDAVKEMVDELDQAKGKVNVLEGLGRAHVADVAKEGANAVNGLGEAFSEAGSGARGMAADIANADSELKQLQQSTQYFFSLRNMFNLLKRGVKEAFQVVKELDAAMTETAVVTNFSVGDMWAKLPEYTANANALGATIKDMYESTTLYYQQGLDTEQAMSIATETMKMARIAGLEAAEATDMMTAALRGFNMELNETSAQRINDVYSNLAAKTASDTEELGTAMQRTASIAASAGMSFEGTAAFLAQAIETTREPAENIGTAMKTIVARFQEMKKNPLEITEVDGEEVSYNKVDAALQSIGVSLKDANGQFRELDQVFLDIAQKWDSLTQTQQRYIATTAAGSRQQSRFIAMMSNYDRTMELMEYANDSAGASQEQFGKTLDSLEAKLNKFKNAWNEFLMGIMNDSWTKAIVDFGTKALDIVNKLIDALSLGGKAKGIKSFLSLFAAFNGLKFAGRGINGVLGGLGNMLTPGSNKTFMQGFKSGIGDVQASRFTSPIVKAINGLIPHIDKNVVGYKNKYEDFGNYFGARRELYKQLHSDKGAYSIQEVYDTIDKNKLTQAQEKLLFQSMPGLKKSLTSNLESVLSQSLEAIGGDKKMAKSLVRGFAKGNISLDEVLVQSGLYKTLATRMAEAGEQGGQILYNKAYKEFVSNSQNLESIHTQLRNQNITPENTANYRQYVNQAINKQLLNTREVASPEIEYLLNQQFQLTKLERVSQGFSRVGGTISSLGMQLQMLGAQCAETNPILGETISKFGSLLTTAGMIPNMIGSIIAGGPAVIALAVALGTLTRVVIKTQQSLKDIKQAAEDVVTNFKKTTEETEANISALKQYETQVGNWAKGVDEFGNNINLSDEDFAQYQEAVAKIAEINPNIVEGYNAQGKAIIDINKALSETIKLEQQRQEEAFEDYLDPSSFEKLVKARNSSDDYQKIVQASFYSGNESLDNFINTPFMRGFNRIVDRYLGNTLEDIAGKEYQEFNETPFAPQVGDILKKTTTLYKEKDLKFAQKIQNKLAPKWAKELTNANESQTQAIEDIFKQYDADYEALLEGGSHATKQFMAHRSEIKADLTELFDGELPSSIDDLFSSLDEQAEAYEEQNAEMISWLQTYASHSLTSQNASPELMKAVNAGVEEVVNMSGMSFDDMITETDNIIEQFSKLTEEGSEYDLVLQGVTEAQNEFARTLDDTQYLTDVQDELATLDKLLEQYQHKTDAYSVAVTEFLTNQKAKIEQFTEGGTVSLTEALNEAIGYIRTAEGALESFQSETKTDIDTGRNNMKSIYDTIWEGDHAAVKGDKTFWKGAEYLLGKNTVREIYDKEDIEGVRKALKGLEAELQEGEDGFAAFWNNLRSVKNGEVEGFTWDEETGRYNIDKTANPHVYEDLADAMGRSVEYVVSMLNAGRQWADINFANPTEVRKALGTDGVAIKGTSGEGQRDLFVTEDYLRDALYEAEYYSPEDQDNAIAFLESQGVKLMATPEEVDQQDFVDWGISDPSTLIKTLGDTGQFSKEDIMAYAEKFEGENAFNPEKFNEMWTNYEESRENPSLEPIQSIDSSVAQIVSLMKRQQLESGHATDSDVNASEDFLNSIIGKEGENDGKNQMFGEGKNELGATLTPQEFEKTKQDLEQARAVAQEQLDAAKQGLENKNISAQDRERLQQIVDNYTQAINSIDANLTEGVDKWPELYAEAQKQRALDEGFSDENNSVAGVQQHAQEVYEQAYEEAQKLIEGAADGTLDGIVDSETTGSEPGVNDIESQAQDAAQKAKQEVFAKLKSEGMSAAEANQKAQEAYDKTYSEFYAGTTEIKDSVESGIIEGTADGSEFSLFDNGQESKNIYQKAAEITNDIIGGLIDGINDVIDKTQPPNAEPRYGTTGAPSMPNSVIKAEGSKPTSSGGMSTNHVVVEKVEGSEEVNKTIDDVNSKAEAGAVHTTIFRTRDESTPRPKENTGNKPTGGILTNQTPAAKTPVEVEDKTVPQVKNIVQRINRTKAYIDVGIRQTGNRTVTINVKKGGGKTIGSFSESISGGYTGLSNKISYTHIPLLGSLAGGTKKGRVGPKNQGGLTLTGELGYEVAWLPSENRSMILGANGPQMVNLPKDAVVYNHEQSKEIMKKRASIGAGSMGSGTYTPSNSPGGGSGADRVVNEAKKAGQNVSNAARNSADKIARVTVWWENAARRAEAIQRETDANQKTYEKYLKEMHATISTTGTIGQGNDYIKNTKKYIQEQVVQFNKAVEELNQMDSGKWQSGKRKGKKAKGKSAYKSGADNVIQVSYQGKNGKNKTAYINTAQYLKYDSKSGSYQIDQAKLNKSIKNANKRKAFADALNQELNNRISKKNKAEDEIQKAREALEKMSEELYDTFLGWEIELTKIWNITQKIEEAEGRIAQNDAYKNLLEAQLGSGIRKAGQDTKNEAIKNFELRVQNQQEILKERQDLINESASELQRALSGEDERTTLANVQKKLAGKLEETDRLLYEADEKKLKDRIKMMDAARKFFTVNPRADGTISIEADYQALADAQQAGDINSTLGKEIQDYIKGLVEKSKDLQTNYKDLTNDITEYYTALKDLKKQRSDYSEQLVNISEQAEKKKLESLKKLNDGVKQALDSLLKKVKDALDERRRQEDNVKIERDISQKQQRLAALRADTAGGHQVEIAQLEKEIADAQQNYQRTLEDQLLDKLQQQADLASEQRERQIALQETIASSVNNIALVNMWMRNPEQYKEQMKQAYLEANDYENKTDDTQIVLEDEFETLYNGIISNEGQQKILTKTIATLTPILQLIYEQMGGSNLDLKTAKAQNMNLNTAKETFAQATLSDFIDAGYTIEDFAGAGISYEQAKAAGFTDKDLAQNDTYHDAAQKAIDDAKAKADKEAADKQKKANETAYQNKLKSAAKNSKTSLSEIQALGKVAQAAGHGPAKYLQDLANTKEIKWTQILKALKGHWSKYRLAHTFTSSGFKKAYDEVYGKGAYSSNRKTATKNSSKYPKYAYASGGLADYTGLAWLDGTPSRPELVLDSKDTQNFIALRDVLAKVVQSSDSIGSYGNAIYEININVDHLNSDYDVDRVVERVKKDIVKSAGYRNVTQVRNFK